MSSPSRPLSLAAALVPAALLVLSFPTVASPAAQHPRGALVLLVADQSLYLCPLCGERFMAACRALAARYGPDSVWVIVSPAGEGSVSPSGDFKAAVGKRIRAFLRANGCTAAVILDANGSFRIPGRILPAGWLFDQASGIAQDLSLLPKVLGKTP